MRRNWGFPLVTGLMLLVGCQQPIEPPKPPPPPEVFYTRPTEKVVVDSEEYPGRLAAEQMVEVRSRVTGYLDEVRFKDGDLVQAGDVLFSIDPRPYLREVEHAEATLAQATAHRNRTQRQEQRLKNLVGMKIVSQEEYDTALFDDTESQAAIKAAEASLEIAKLNLDYTKITAKVSGRIGRRLVDAGNLVKADDTALATIVSLDPIYAYFSIDERTMLKLRRLMQDGKLSADENGHFNVDLALADEDEFSWQGKVTFLDNQIDAHTGTLAARATIKNESGFLSPGLFVRMRTPIGEPRPSLMVPEEALGSDQGQRFLYIVDDANKVNYRRVTVGKGEQGERVILTGLEKGERVIVSGLQRVRPNLEVSPKDVKAPQATSEAPPAAVATQGTVPHAKPQQTTSLAPTTDKKSAPTVTNEAASTVKNTSSSAN